MRAEENPPLRCLLAHLRGLNLRNWNKKSNDDLFSSWRRSKQERQLARCILMLSSAIIQKKTAVWINNLVCFMINVWLSLFICCADRFVHVALKRDQSANETTRIIVLRETSLILIETHLKLTHQRNESFHSTRLRDYRLKLEFLTFIVGDILRSNILNAFINFLQKASSEQARKTFIKFSPGKTTFML